uniref:Uncharacterized protein n=1 Tax=Arundo donax TaxID=35708 RepID=A0A0A8ZFU1_ARUDO
MYCGGFAFFLFWNMHIMLVIQ